MPSAHWKPEVAIDLQAASHSLPPIAPPFVAAHYAPCKWVVSHGMLGSGFNLLGQKEYHRKYHPTVGYQPALARHDSRTCADAALLTWYPASL